MILYYIVLYLYIFFIFAVTIITHELGHYLYIRLILKQKPKVEWKKGRIGVRYRSNISRWHKIGIMLWGIFLGLIPLTFFTGAGEYYGIFLWLYFVGCSRDIWKIGENLLKVE